MQLVEDADLMPSARPTPAGLAGAEPQLPWQQLPAHIVVEHVQDALQAQPVVRRLELGAFYGQGGSSGSISAQKSSSTIHGRFPTPHKRRNRRTTGHGQPAHTHKIVLRAHRDTGAAVAVDAFRAVES